VSLDVPNLYFTTVIIKPIVYRLQHVIWNSVTNFWNNSGGKRYPSRETRRAASRCRSRGNYLPWQCRSASTVFTTPLHSPLSCLSRPFRSSDRSIFSSNRYPRRPCMSHCECTRARAPSRDTIDGRIGRCSGAYLPACLPACLAVHDITNAKNKLHRQ